MCVGGVAGSLDRSLWLRLDSHTMSQLPGVILGKRQRAHCPSPTFLLFSPESSSGPHPVGHLRFPTYQPLATPLFSTLG